MKSSYLENVLGTSLAQFNIAPILRRFNYLRLEEFIPDPRYNPFPMGVAWSFIWAYSWRCLIRKLHSGQEENKFLS